LDPVRVPDNAGKGVATIKLSLSEWNEGRVAPATYQVPIK